MADALEGALAAERSAREAETASGRAAAEGRLAAILAAWARAPRAALGLPAGGAVRAAALQRAYLRAAKVAHPDKGGAHRVFLGVKAARDALAPSALGDAEPLDAGDALFFADDPLAGAVHGGHGYESRFWSAAVAGGAGKRDRDALWHAFDAAFDARAAARKAEAWA